MPLKSFIFYIIKPQKVIYLFMAFCLCLTFIYFLKQYESLYLLILSTDFTFFIFTLYTLFSSLMITNDVTFPPLYIGTKTLIRFQICDMANNETEKDWYHVNKLNIKLIRAHFKHDWKFSKNIYILSVLFAIAIVENSIWKLCRFKLLNAIFVCKYIWRANWVGM